VLACPDDAPFLLKVRWLLEALFHPLRAAPWHVAEGDALGVRPGLDCGLTTVGWAGADGKALGGIALSAVQASWQGIWGSPGGVPGRDLHYPAESC
jgi:hypothetical protein